MEKYNLTENDLLAKLTLIEQHMGKCPSNFYEPSTHFRSSDEILIQKEASMMMKHVGLNHHVACITYTETRLNTGGNVELDNSENVFIDISKDLKGQDAKVLAVMAHEICHKVLYVHGLYYPNLSIENEILTDLATVYLGFGKLSLNGCYNKKVVNCKESKDEKNAETIRTTIESIGYLSLKQFSQAYNIVCGCNGTLSTMLIGLNSDAREMVLRTPFNIQAPIKTTEIKQVLRSIQIDDAKTTNYIKTIEGILHTLKNIIKENQTQYNKDLVLPFNLDSGSDIIEHQMKAAEMLTKYEIDVVNPNSDTISTILKQLIVDYRKICKTDDTQLLTIECPCCGYKKNNGLKEYKEVFVKCPNCGHYFLWNAKNDYYIEDKEGSASEEIRKNKDSVDNNINNNQNRSKNHINTFNRSKDITYRYLKYLFIIAFLLSYIPLCIFVNIPWIFKVMMVFPYSLFYYILVKNLLPNDYDANFDVKGDYNGGDLNVDYRGIGETLMGKFGSGSSSFFSKFKGEFGAYRAYVFITILFITIPINCLVLKEDTKPEDELMNKRKYKVYGTSKWFLLEVLWLYLRKYCYIAAVVIVIYFLNYLWCLFK